MNMFDWYLKVVRDNYANFSGRARRSEYWYFVLTNFIFMIALFILGMLVNAEFILYVLYSLALFIPGLAVAVRRLHDVGKSGWFYLISLIPLIGPIWLLILFFTEGDNGPNEYGPDPKNIYDEFDDIGKQETY